MGAAVAASDATSTADGTASTTTDTPAPTATAAASDAGATAQATTPSATATEEAVATDSASGTYDGALISTKEGAFQAEIVVEAGTITAVNVLVDGDDRHDSVRINETALPLLQERVLSAQTWDVEGISGASYTVQGFLTSVKDAMTQAGLT